MQVESLHEQFEQLSDEEKFTFAKGIMPEFCRIAAADPRRVKEEIMPACREAMQRNNMNMGDTMSMMGMPGMMGDKR